MSSSATFGLDGRVAIVTGSSSGIGAAIARAFVAAGAATALVGRDETRLRAVASEADPDEAQVTTIALDLCDAGAPQTIVDRTLARFGRIDAIVHSAGVFFPTAFEAVTETELDDQWAVNVRAPFLLTQAALPHLGDGASVVFISSMMGAVGGAMCTAYCATKGAIEQLSKALAVELGERGVRFNCIAPGAVETPMNEGFREDRDFYESFRTFPPAQRWGAADEIAPAAVFLCSPAAAFIHGARLAVDGGWVAR
jgi:NAD(P)-dependent dehydrogenase (short-subunit alcohol dehydrogenase family)